jgi:hypothetical protein
MRLAWAVGVLCAGVVVACGPGAEPNDPSGEDADLSEALRTITGEQPGQPPPGPGTGPTPAPGSETPPTAVAGDWTPGVYIMHALRRLTAVSASAQERYSLGFASGGSSIFGAFIVPGAPAMLSREFVAGTRYVLIGATDDDGYNIDIIIRDTSGNSVAEDVAPDPNPVVEFTPTVTGNYRVELRTAGQAFATMAVMEQSGFTVPADRIETSVFGSVQKAAELSKTMRERSGNSMGLNFHANGDWCLLGTVMEQGDVVSQWFTLEGEHVFLASGDASASNLDLALLDDNQSTVAADTEVDAIPGFRVEGRQGNHRLELSVMSANSLTLVTMVALNVQRQ